MKEQLESLYAKVRETLSVRQLSDEQVALLSELKIVLERAIEVSADI